MRQRTRTVPTTKSPASPHLLNPTDSSQHDSSEAEPHSRFLSGKDYGHEHIYPPFMRRFGTIRGDGGEDDAITYRLRCSCCDDRRSVGLGHVVLQRMRRKLGMV
jgi:hypothetical protein